MGRKYDHLTLEQRVEIEHGLDRHESFTTIGENIGKDRTSVMREVFRNRQLERGPSNEKNDRCGHWDDCPMSHGCESPCLKSCCRDCERICGDRCPEYSPVSCKELFHAPYVCNKCRHLFGCTLNKYFYKADIASYGAHGRLVTSGEGADVSEDDAAKHAEILKEGFRRGLSIYRIMETNGGEEAFGCTARTIYNRVENGVYKDVSATNMIHRLYKPRHKKPDYAYKVDRKCLEGRRFEDFTEFMDQHPGMPVVQMDTVEGSRDEKSKFLLTLLFSNCNLQLAYVIEHQRSSDVTEVFDKLWDRLGEDLFRKLFPVILTDNGSEFSNPGTLEYSKEGILRTRIFYCHPQASFEKGQCENNHKEIRIWQPKGKPILMFQREAYFMMSNINSAPRKDFGGRSPFDMFNFIYRDESIIKKLGLQIIPPKDICLKPELFK